MSINHRAEAERHLSQGSFVKSPEQPHPVDPVATDFHLRMAQVHATLARDEEQADRTADMRDALRLLRGREYDVRKVVSTHIAKALASREPNRWKAGRALAQALDMVDFNLDDAIDARLSDDGWDPRSAWKDVASAVPASDPWSPRPDITAEIPEPVRRVIAEHLARMLLDGDSEVVQMWARNLAYALKNDGADLTPDIEKQIRDRTLGRDPSEPPF